MGGIDGDGTKQKKICDQRSGTNQACRWWPCRPNRPLLFPQPFWERGPKTYGHIAPKPHKGDKKLSIPHMHYSTHPLPTRKSTPAATAGQCTGEPGTGSGSARFPVAVFALDQQGHELCTRVTFPDSTSDTGSDKHRQAPDTWCAAPDTLIPPMNSCSPLQR